MSTVSETKQALVDRGPKAFLGDVLAGSGAVVLFSIALTAWMFLYLTIYESFEQVGVFADPESGHIMLLLLNWTFGTPVFVLLVLSLAYALSLIFKTPTPTRRLAFQSAAIYTLLVFSPVSLGLG